MKPDFSKIELYDLDMFTLIPLHKWHQTSERKAGKISYDGKRPLATRWTSVTEQMPMAELKELVSRGHNVGVLLRADQVIFDVDPQNYPLDADFEPIDMFAKFCEDQGFDINDYPHVRTGSGGYHIYMSKPADLKHCNQHVDYPGLEFKSKGQQVVAAGSVHPKAERLYEWVKEPEFLEPLPEAHPWILDMFREAAERRSTASIGEQILGPDELEELLAGMDPLDFRDHDSWFELMAALHDTCGGDPACGGVFDMWCQGDPESYSGDVLFRWDSFDTTKNTRITQGSLKKIVAKKAKDESKKLLSSAISRKASSALSSAGDDFEDDIEVGEQLPAKKKKRMVPNSAEVLGTQLRVGKNGAPNTPTNAKIAINNLNLKPQYNVLSQQITFGRPIWDVGQFGTAYSDELLSWLSDAIIAMTSDLNYNPGEDLLFRAIKEQAQRHRYNPVTDYLDGLEWDGEPRIHRLFGDYFNCGRDEYTDAVSTAFMIGAIQRARHPGCKRDEMPVLKGAQGAGKSTGILTLAGKKFFSDADLGKLNEKDAPIALQGTWIHEFAELDGLRDHESSTLKGFLSRGVDKYRAPYGRTVQEVPRRSVFIGTCNEGGFLKDATGNRRYWPMTVLGPIDKGMIARDRDQLWAEADAAASNGVSRFLPDSLWGVAAERQMAETTVDPWVEQLQAYLDSEDETTGTERIDRVSGRELLDFLTPDKGRQTKKMASKVKGIMLDQLGWEYKRALRIDGVLTSGYQRVDV